MSSKDIIWDLRNTYNLIADDFDSTRGYNWRECLDFVSNIKRGDVVIDLGCGNGRNLVLAKDKTDFCIGADFSSGFMKVVRKKDESIPLVLCEFQNIPFSDNSFDHVMFIASIHHLPGKSMRLKALAEMARIMKVKGDALVSVWAHEQEKFKDFPQDIDVRWNKKHPRIYHLFKKGELDNLISSVDSLEIVDSFGSENNYYVKVKKV